jgi:Tol biopolymer transport system component
LPAPANAGSAVILSPDGTRLVYEASVAGGPTKLFTRRLDQLKATELPGTDGADGPFFSPDGQWVAFAVGNKLNKISVDGGAVVPLGDVTPYGGGSWAADGSVVAAQLLKGLVRVSPGGAAPTAITEIATGEFIQEYPQILPGDKAALFTAYTTPPDPEKASIDVVTFADHHRKTLVRGGVSPRYAASSNGTGHLLYINKGTLYAIPFDPNHLETSGAAVPVVDGVATAVQASGGGQYDLSKTGTLIYRRGTGGPTSGMVTVRWLDANGKTEALVTKPASYQGPRLSPDGRRLAVVIREGSGQDVWVYEMQRETWTKLSSGGTNVSPIWSPDGKYIVFGALATGMMWTRSDGAGQPQPLTQSKSIQVPWSFTPDGKRLAYIDVSNASGGGGAQIWTLPLEGEGGQWKGGTAEPFLKTQFTDVTPAFSPDGHWLAYQSNESGRDEVYVRPFPIPSSGQGGKWTISSNGGIAPVWSKSGHELLYLSGAQIMAVSYSVKGDAFQQEKARVWAAKLGGGQWDLAPDGKRLAVLMPVEAPEAPKADHEVVFLQNFFDELRRKAPVK